MTCISPLTVFVLFRPGEIDFTAKCYAVIDKHGPTRLLKESTILAEFVAPRVTPFPQSLFFRVVKVGFGKISLFHSSRFLAPN